MKMSRADIDNDSSELFDEIHLKFCLKLNVLVLESYVY